MVSMGYWSITTSGFLAAYALALGATNLQIGMLASLSFLAQLIQIPAIVLVERIRKRKLIALITWIPAQLIWIPIALIPLYMDIPSPGAISALLGLMALRSTMGAITNCSWNSWMRDLVPQKILGRFFARRYTLANGAAMLFGLGAAFFVDYWRGDEALGYTIPLLFGALTLALASPTFMTLIPEPLMQPAPSQQQSLLTTLATPFRDRNYRHLLSFLFLWGLALNLAVPFLAVYMLQRLGLPLSAVIGFSMLGQASNILFLRLWGPLVDQFGSKVILSLCTSLYMLVILGWTFTTMPERYFLTIPLLVILHILAGAAASGVTLTTGTIGLKVAPKGQATSYLAVAALATNLGYGLGPLLGGQLADYFSGRQLGITLTWLDPTHTVQLMGLSFTGFDFLFCITFVIGIITLNALIALREEGETSREVALDALLSPMRQVALPMSSVPGLNFLSQFPFGFLRRAPIPGLDVALGVTAYQVAEITKAATLASMQGRNVRSKITRAIENSVKQLWKETPPGQLNGEEVAKQAARGTIHASKEAAYGEELPTRPAVLGIVRALRKEKVPPEDILQGIGYGLVQGAVETDTDLSEAVGEAVSGAREAASTLNMTEDTAIKRVAEGAIAAAEALGHDAVTQVKETLDREPEENPPQPEGECSDNAH